MFKLNYKGMTEEQMKELSDMKFDLLKESGRSVSWFATFCDVTPATVHNWKNKGAPVMIMRILDNLLGEDK